MKAIDTASLDQARQMIKERFGALSDLPEDVRNTITNTYYEFCHMGIELNQEFAMPQSVMLADDPVKGMQEYTANASHILPAAQNMPEILLKCEPSEIKGCTRITSF